MKKLILMTSALTLVGGTAFAGAHGGGEVSISAEASVAFGNWDDAAGPNATAAMSYGTSVTATLEGSAGDVSYGGSLTIEDADNVELGEIWISTSVGKFMFDQDTYNADIAESEGGDIAYNGSFGDITLDVVVDADTQAWLVGASTALSGINAGVKFDSTNAWEVSADTTVGAVTVGATFDDTNAWEVTASTSVSGLDISASFDDTSAWDVTVGGTAGAVAWEATVDSNSEYAASATATFGDTAVEVAYDSDANYDDAGSYDSDDAVFQASVTHTVGGLVLHAMVNDNQDYEVGATASFSF
jgi:hypothetical protein